MVIIIIISIRDTKVLYYANIRNNFYIGKIRISFLWVQERLIKCNLRISQMGNDKLD